MAERGVPDAGGAAGGNQLRALGACGSAGLSDVRVHWIQLSAWGFWVGRLV